MPALVRGAATPWSPASPSQVEMPTVSQLPVFYEKLTTRHFPMQHPGVSMLARVFLKQHVRQRRHLCGPLLASELVTVTTELEGDCFGARRGQAGQAGARALTQHAHGGSTYFVTTLIFTPKTPVCFLDGVLFRLMSRLVNFMENSTLIWLGVRQSMSAPKPRDPSPGLKQGPPLAPKAP